MKRLRKVLLLRAPRLPLLPLRLSGASCGGARRRQHARLSSSCWKLREALRALAHPELGAPTKTMELMEPMELLLLLVDSMKLLLEPLELLELLELAERKGVLLLKKYRGEKRLRPCRLLQPVLRGRVLRVRLRLRLAAPRR